MMGMIFRFLPMASADLNSNETVGTGSVRVWDAPTRCFHWAIVCLITISWITAETSLIKLHLWSGSLLLTLLIFRIAWGLVGSTTARFRHFVTRPRTAIGYLKSLMQGVEKLSYLGHNPAGGWMVVVLIMVLGLQVATGLFANDDVHFIGPLASMISKEMSDRLTARESHRPNVHRQKEQRSCATGPESAVYESPFCSVAVGPVGRNRLVDRPIMTHLSFLADIAVAPDRQIRAELHPSRQSLESLQVQRTKVKIRGRSRHATSW
jgi:cytochrome b